MIPKFYKTSKDFEEIPFNKPILVKICGSYCVLKRTHEFPGFLQGNAINDFLSRNETFEWEVIEDDQPCDL